MGFEIIFDISRFLTLLPKLNHILKKYIEPNFLNTWTKHKSLELKNCKKNEELNWNQNWETECPRLVKLFPKLHWIGLFRWWAKKIITCMFMLVYKHILLFTRDFVRATPGFIQIMLYLISIYNILVICYKNIKSKLNQKWVKLTLFLLSKLCMRWWTNVKWINNLLTRSYYPKYIFLHI